MLILFTCRQIRQLLICFLPLVILSSTTLNGQSIHYVKPVASGLGDGSSWTNASGDLQEMIDSSVAGDQVWVSAGVYKPTIDPAGNTNPADPRDVTFRLKPGVELYGGFAGTETVLSARDFNSNLSVLSGDIGVVNDQSDNAYHVVLAFPPIGNTFGYTLDGFTIRDGNASTNSSFIAPGAPTVVRHQGGGVYIELANVVLRNCRISHNSALSNGGGIYKESGGTLTLIKDSIFANTASSGGGGFLDAYIIDSSAVFDNTALYNGGGMYIGVGSLSNSSIYDNDALGGVGGGLSINSIIECRNNFIFNNTANGYWGGGIFYSGSASPYASSFFNNVIYGNSAEKGAGIYNLDGNGNYFNNTIVNNSAIISGGGLTQLGGVINVRNNLFWNNKRANSSTLGAADLDIFTVFFITNHFYNNLFQLSGTSYNLGPSSGNNLFTIDPMLLDVNQPIGADGIPGTADDGFNLTVCSPLINAGATTSPGVLSDILGNPRVSNYDIGAYEYQGTVPVYAGVILGDTQVCLNGTTVLTNSVSGGIWSSSDTSIVTVSSNGVVTGINYGTASIFYTTDTFSCSGTTTSTSITVAATPTLSPIIGPDSACAGSTIQLSINETGGSWSSSNTAVAGVSPTGFVWVVGSGLVTISYHKGPTGCSDTVSKTIAVGASPTVGTITGNNLVCVGATEQFLNPTPGGVWSTISNGVKGSISPTGLLTGVSAGYEQVRYTVTTPYGCQVMVTKSVSVVSSPPSYPIVGDSSVCEGDTIHLVNDGVVGTWSTSDSQIATVTNLGFGTSVVTGVGAGSASIFFAMVNSLGCTSTVSKNINVLPIMPVNAISGGTGVCIGNLLQLSNTTPGGIWQNTSGGVVSLIDASGLVTPISPGTDTITYTVGGSNPCPQTVYHIVNVVNVPIVDAIQGTDSLCIGQGAMLTNTTQGGSWASDNPSVASVDASGLVTGIAAGAATISYTVGGAIQCPVVATKTVYVKLPPVVNPIIGASSVCIGSGTQYSNTTPGGIWSTASNGIISSISASGLLTTTAAGIDTVIYTVINSLGCVSFAFYEIEINSPQITSISGVDSICLGTNTQMNHVVPGGSWSNFDVNIGAVSSTGLYSSITPGIDTVYYQYLSNGCPAQTYKSINVIAPPNLVPIIGDTALCIGETSQLTVSEPGGFWSGNNNSVASVDTNGQVVTVSSGTVTVNYTLVSSPGCSTVSSKILTVNEAIVTTSQNLAVLTATGNQNGAFYQWIDCNSGNQEIVGANGPVFTASNNGNFAVVVSFMGCVDTSICLSVTSVGLEEVGDSIASFIRPNPATDFIEIGTHKSLAKLVQLIDMHGRRIRTVYPEEHLTRLDVRDIARGMYYIHVVFEDHSEVQKIVLH